MTLNIIIKVWFNIGLFVVHTEHSIWSTNTQEAVECRAFYFWQRFKWAKQWNLNPPRLKTDGRLIRNVGEVPRTKSLIYGSILVYCILVHTGMKGNKQIKNGTGITGRVFGFLMWK